MKGVLNVKRSTNGIAIRMSLRHFSAADKQSSDTPNGNAIRGERLLGFRETMSQAGRAAKSMAWAVSGLREE